jgi:hypothetical protein
MKQFLKISIFIPFAFLMFIIDVPQQQTQFPYFQLVSEAHAIFGVRRRALRRGVVIGSSMAATEAAVTHSAEPAPAAPVQQQPAAVQQQSGAGLLPMGKIVSTLPKGCTTLQASGVEYYHCGVNYYRATFQGNKLIYVTSQPN